MEAMSTSRVQLARCARPAASLGATRRPVASMMSRPTRVHRRATLGAHRAVVDSAEATEADEEEAAAEEEARDMALQLATIADETRAADIRVLGVTKSVHWARYFVLATAFNRPQMQAVANKMRDHVNENYGTQLSKAPSQQQQGDWVCLDAGDIVARTSPRRKAVLRHRDAVQGCGGRAAPLRDERPSDQTDEDDDDDEFDVIVDDGLANSPFADGNFD